MDNKQRYYKNEKLNRYFIVSNNYDLQNFNLEEYVSQGIFYLSDYSNENYDFINDLSDNDKAKLVSVWTKDKYNKQALAEAYEEFEEFEEEKASSIEELINGTYLPDYEEMFNSLSWYDTQELANSFTSVIGFTVRGYSQGDIAIVILPKLVTEMYNMDKNEFIDDIQACFYGGYLSIDETDKELNDFEQLDTLYADKYSIYEAYADKLDKYMLDTYSATPATTQTTTTIL